MEEVITFNHKAEFIQLAVLVNGTTIHEIMNRVDKKKTDEFINKLSALLESDDGLSQNVFTNLVVEEAKDNVDELVTYGILAGGVMYEYVPTTPIMLFQMFSQSKKGSLTETMEEALQRAFERLFERHPDKSAEFVFAVRIMLIGMVLAALSKNEETSDHQAHGPSLEECSKCAALNCPIRITN